MLDGVVALPDAEQPAALEQVCREHPEFAADLRERFALFRRLAHNAAGSAPAVDGPRTFGEYELVRELGRGGMGVVYLARQRRGDQERLVALKLIRNRLLLSPQARERLRREGEAAFRLDHPGICAALDVGEIDGTPFVAMRYVPGRTLASWVAEAHQQHQLPEPTSDAARDESSGSSSTTVGSGRIRSLLALVEQVARALHAAHQAGFVHRDVKPGNIMVTPDGAPVLLDFGLVHDESSTHGLTATDQPLGTPTYMSPEQIEPHGRRIDRTTDVYSLGVTLFEVLVGEPPFTGHNREALFRQILDREPPDLRRRVKGVSRDLAVVVATALAKDPGRRYATALALAEDLRRVRQAQPILARPPGIVRRMQLWSQRNRLAAAVLLLLGLSQVAIVALVVRAEARTDEALVAKGVAFAAQARAEEDYAVARDAVADLTQVAQQHLADVPWMEAVRRELFEKSLAFHRRVLARPATTPEQHLQAAAAQVLSASLLKDLGQIDEARRLAVAAGETLAAQAAGNPTVRHWLARGGLLLAKLDDEHGAVDGAEAHYRAAIEQLEAVGGARDHADDLVLAQVRRRLAAMIARVGGRHAEAAALVDRALAQVVGSADADARVEHAALLRLRARMCRDQGDHAGAGRDFQFACQSLRDVLAQRPQDSEAMAALSATLVSLGVLQVELQQHEQALASYQEALIVQEALAAAFPFVTQHRGNLASTLSNLAAQQRRCGMHAESRRTLERSLELNQQLYRADPENAMHRENLAAVCLNLANQIKYEDHGRAVGLYRQGLEAVTAKLQRTPDDWKPLDLACRIANSLGGTLAGQRQDAEALAMLAMAREFGNRLQQHPNAPERARRNLAVLYFNEGTLACEVGDLPTARLRLQSAVAHGASMLAGRSGDLRTRIVLLSHWVRLCIIEELIDPAAALAHWQAAVDVGETADANDKAALLRDADAQQELACALRGLAAAHLRAGRPTDAAPLLARAEELLAAPDNVAETVERLLLARDQAALALARDDAAAAASALSALAELAAKVRADIGSSRLHTARLRQVVPEVEALLRRAGRDDLLSGWQELAAVLGS